MHSSSATSMTQPFLSPRLTGLRFEGHAIPLEFLKDLAVLEEMVIEVAKWRYLKDHPERQRLPRQFAKGMELKLTAVLEGSAVAEISLTESEDRLFPTEEQEYLIDARDSIIRAIAAAEHHQEPTQYLPEKALTYFDRFGRSLRDDEAIELASETCQDVKVARLTRVARHRLVLSSSRVQDLTEEVVVRGLVPEADQDRMTFQLLLYDGRRVRAPIPPQHLDTIVEAFNSYRSHARVQIQGVGRVDRSQRLQGLESVSHIVILDPRDVPARLDELRMLKDGWLDGRGLAPSARGLDRLSQAFDKHFPDEVVLPLLFPTAEGGILAEWGVKPFDISLEIDLDRFAGDWHSLNLETNSEDTRELDLNQPESWQWIAEQLRAIEETQL